MIRISRLVALVVCGLFLHAGSAKAAADKPRATGKSSTPAPAAEAPAAAPAPVAEATSGTDELSALLDEEVAAPERSTLSMRERRKDTLQVYSVGRDVIRRNGWRSVGEVLAAIPGMYLVHDGVTSHVAIRGVGPGVEGGTRHVRVMINGTPVSFRPTRTTQLGPELIPMDVVDRIEIARGPLTSVYGTDAFLATVNVITRQPEAKTAGMASLHSVVNEGGAGGGIGATVMLGSENATLLVTGQSERLDRSGLTIARTFAGQDGAWLGQRTESDVMAPATNFVRFTVKNFGGGMLAVQGGTQRVDALGEFQPGSFLTHKNQISTSAFWGSAGWRRPLGERFALTLEADIHTGGPREDERLFATGISGSEFRRRVGALTTEARAELEGAFGDWLHVAAGVDGSLERHTTLAFKEIYNQPPEGHSYGEVVDHAQPGVPENVQFGNLAVFTQARSAPIAALPGLVLFGSARVDFPTQFDPMVSWRAAATHAFTELISARASVGRSVQAPTAVMLYAQPGFGSAGNLVGTRTVDVPALKNQDVTSAELGLSGTFARANVDATLFAQRLNNAFEYRPYGLHYLPANAGARNVYGYEVAAEGSLGRFQPFANLGMVFDEAGGFGPNGQEMFPSTWFRSGLNVGIPELRMHLSGIINVIGHRRPTAVNIAHNGGEVYDFPTYVTGDLSVATDGFKLLPVGDETRFSIAVRNITGRRWSEPFYGGVDLPSQGRVIYIELGQTF